MIWSIYCCPYTYPSHFVFALLQFNLTLVLDFEMSQHVQLSMALVFPQNYFPHLHFTVAQVKLKLKFICELLSTVQKNTHIQPQTQTPAQAHPSKTMRSK